jgi:hypothetical protein
LNVVLFNDNVTALHASKLPLLIWEGVMPAAPDASKLTAIF